ncbi:Uu.00g013050.m01.CDS01 [Anthostomella pinea]|uniref:Uu.00g013050.m01.CDS01 n=1 Tax=Anthostomella pinea TaxID=933095 RepID=A0AAI8VY22_9PEZI|nr:Uu.00g013050.m01.CDS01 [Anthostomella pinea]
MTSETDNIVRPVGTAAKFNTSRHSLGLYRSVINTSRYTVSRTLLQQQQTSLATVIENALAAVVLRHGLLRVGIAGEDTKEPAFAHLRAIYMRRMIEWEELRVSSEEWDERLLRSLERRHELLWEDLARKPGWKIVVHHDPRDTGTALHGNNITEAVSLDISFCFHHAYADGKSGAIFHRDLVSALNSNSASASHSQQSPPELQNHILPLPSPPALPPPLETLVPLPLSWPFLLRTIWAELLYPVLVPAFAQRMFAQEMPWTGGVIDASSAVVRQRLLQIPQKELVRVLDACRARGATLTGLVHALVLGALCWGGKMRDEAAHAFRGETPISLAGYADPKFTDVFRAEDSMHCLVTAHVSVFDAVLVKRFRRAGSRTEEREALVWDLAADVTKNLHKRAAELPRDDILGLLHFVSDWHDFFRKKLGKQRECSWEVSNIGSMKSPKGAIMDGGSDGWCIVRSVFTQGAAPAGAAFKVNVAGVEGEGLTLAVSWQEGIVDDEVMEGVVRDMGRWLHGLGEGGRLDL